MPRATLYSWDDIALDKVTEMVAKKVIVTPAHRTAQVYVKKGSLVPRHAHEVDQWVYLLQGALRVRLDRQDVTVREGEVLHVPAGVHHQAEALDDTFLLDVRAG